eukprot:Sspe_Gene.113678::Locus_98387_Transcript_1_1_Confidence_1.000_Length_448::g.113678::m.113678
MVVFSNGRREGYRAVVQRRRELRKAQQASPSPDDVEKLQEACRRKRHADEMIGGALRFERQKKKKKSDIYVMRTAYGSSEDEGMLWEPKADFEAHCCLPQQGGSPPQDIKKAYTTMQRYYRLFQQEAARLGLLQPAKK